MMRAEMTWPNGQNALNRSTFVMSFGMWKTNRLQPSGPCTLLVVWIGGPGCGGRSAPEWLAAVAETVADLRAAEDRVADQAERFKQESEN